jgi:hypothetical protein
VIKWLSEIHTTWFLAKMDGRLSAKARLALLLFTTRSPQQSTLLVDICPALGRRIEHPRQGQQDQGKGHNCTWQ